MFDNLILKAVIFNLKGRVAERGRNREIFPPLLSPPNARSHELGTPYGSPEWMAGSQYVGYPLLSPGDSGRNLIKSRGRN